MLVQAELTSYQNNGVFMTDDKLIAEFLAYLKDIKKTSDNTLSAYERDLRAFSEFVSLNDKAVVFADSKLVEKYKQVLTKNGKSVATISRCMSSLRSFYKYLVVSGVCDVNPTVEVKNDKVEKKFFEILTEEEVDKLLAQPDTDDFKGIRDKAMLEMLYATGMKVSELMSLNVSDVNLKMGCVKCRNEKDASKNRIILLYPSAVKVVGEYISHSRSYFVSNPDEHSLFVNTSGDRMTRQGFWKLLKLYAKNAGINKSITPHTLRHSFATHLLENGADINDIKDILGHADISSTNVYSDFIKSRIKKSYVRFNHRSK